jgi:cell division protein FtsQ
MREIAEQIPGTRTWREIPQPVRPRAMSREGRRRYALAGLKTASLVGLLAAAVWTVVELADTWQAEPGRIAHAVGTLPVSRIDLHDADGPIDRAWVERTLALPRNISLMELDLAGLQQRLLANGQVRSVVLAKTFPATLTVTLVERTPVARLRAENGHDFLVARDGVVFGGIGYDEDRLKTLPWLAGVKLVRQGDGFAPIAGMATVADLLATAQNRAPQLYATWLIVDLARLESDGEIDVQSSEIEKIIFGTDLDFFTQLARLDHVNDARKAPLKSVNVGLGPQVVVDYDDNAAVVRPAAPARPGPVFQFIPQAASTVHRSSKPNRDL